MAKTVGHWSEEKGLTTRFTKAIETRHGLARARQEKDSPSINQQRGKDRGGKNLGFLEKARI